MHQHQLWRPEGDAGSEEDAENEEKYEIDDVFRDISADFRHELWWVGGVGVGEADDD